jgi:predicted MPP superfamily phosphohydrolase
LWQPWDDYSVQPFIKATTGLIALGVAGLAYARWEAQHFTLRRTEIPALPDGQPEMRILHLSDLHLTPGQVKKRDWVHSLRDLRPDAVVVTGDFLSHQDAVPIALATVEPLLDLPGAFVLGSNDYFAPKPINPAKYLKGPSQLQPKRPMLPWPDLVSGLTDAGWNDLSNTQTRISIDGRNVHLRGVDDPHIGRDDYTQVAGAFDSDADLSIGVTHAPYLRVLEGFAGDHADLVLAGHTHGGQLRLPGIGALVTNCDLPTSQARGLSRYGDAYLHVSAGLGTSPYAPIRFACPPEATLITLTAQH